MDMGRGGVATTSEGNQASESGQLKDGALPPGDSYMLPWPLRKLCLCAGVFVAYAQFVSIAFMFVYRTRDAWVPGQGYVTNHGLLAKFLVPAIMFEGGELGTFRYEIWPMVTGGVVLATTGSIGLYLASKAKRAWRWRQALMFLGFCVGFATAVLVTMTHMVGGASRVNFLGTELDNYYFLHGKLEFFGATAFPAMIYLILTLWLLTVAVAKWLRAGAKWDLFPRRRDRI